MALDKVTYAAGKKYVDKSIAGGGISAGKNCTIDNISPITGGNRVTFKWTLDDGTVQTQYMDVMDGDKGETGDAGLGIKAVNINTQNHLIITFDDDTTYDAGELPGGSGEVISVNGKKGVVTLDANDVGALPDDTELFSGDYNDLDNLPDLTDFITNTVDNLVNYYKKTETYTKTEVDNIANTIKNGRFEVVFALPTTDIKTNVIYLVPKPTTQTSNIKDEYINLDGTSAGWEKIGDTEIDLSGYVTTTALNTALANYTTTTDLTTLLTGKVDKVTGKGLSTNDYTNTDKELVDSIPTLAPISLVKDTVGWIGKNLIRLPYVNTDVESRGITFSAKSDGTILFSGTGTDNSTGFIQLIDISKTLYLPAGSYILSDGGNAYGGVQIYLYDDVSGSSRYTGAISGSYMSSSTELYICTTEDTSLSWSESNTYGHDKTFTIGSSAYARVIGRSVNNSYASAVSGTIYPMIRRADITDSTYEPYHESVETMYEEEIHGVNLLKNMAVSKTENDITFTVNSDGSVTVNGTASSTAYLYLLGTDAVIPNIFGGYKLTGCPSGGSGTTYGLIAQGFASTVTSNPTSTDQDNGSGSIVSPSTVSPYIRFYIRVQGGTTVNNLVFKPMLRKATIEDNTYRPYNPQAIQNQLNAQGVLGAKNLMPNNATSQTVNGVTFTVNADKSVTVNGTAMNAIAYTINNNLLNILDSNERYIYSGAPNTASEQTYFAYIGYNPGNQSFNHEYGSGVEFSLKDRNVDYTNVNYYIFIRSGATLNNIVFKPMLRLASDPDDTYQPYAMTNRELTEKTNTLPREVFVTTDTRTTTTNDANTLPCGFTRMNDANSNLPTDGTGGNVWYDILTVRQSNDSSKATWGYGFQLAVQTTTNANMGDMYVRAVNGGETPTWSEWKKLN